VKSEQYERVDRHVYGDEPLALGGIWSYADSHPEMTSREIAEVVVGSVDESYLRVFAKAYVEENVDSHRRHLTRKIEESSERSENPAPSSPKTVLISRFEEQRDSPGKFILTNNKDRKKFKKWMGEAFDEWYDRGHEYVIANKPERLSMFEADWYEGGWQEYHRGEMWRKVSEVVREYAEQIRLEVTEELLRSKFALGDGTELTWGGATVDQHRQRIELLQRNAVGTLETAARHQAAIRMLEEKNVSCLEEYAYVAV
jgi:hypothetical protein